MLGAGIAVAGSHWLRGDSLEAGAARPDDAEVTRISAEELRDALEREATERDTLATELELMRTVVEHLAAAHADSEQAAALDGSLDSAEPPKPSVAPKGPQPPGQQFEEERLAKLGMVESEIANLRQLWDRAQLAKLDLSDRATREGWLMRPRHRRQIAQIELDLRSRLGEDAYDDLLYATNQVNRTEVKQVLGGSAASSAGLRPGDQILSYGGIRVFKPADLRMATAAGTRGEQVRLVVGRGGTSFAVGVPRGPLGVLTNAKSSPPR